MICAIENTITDITPNATGLKTVDTPEQYPKANADISSTGSKMVLKNFLVLAFVQNSEITPTIMGIIIATIWIII